MTKSSDETLIAALRVLARDIVSDDGVANAAIGEAAGRIESLRDELATERVQWRQAVVPGDGTTEVEKFVSTPENAAMFLREQEQLWKGENESLQSELATANAAAAAMRHVLGVLVDFAQAELSFHGEHRGELWKSKMQATVSVGRSALDTNSGRELSAELTTMRQLAAEVMAYGSSEKLPPHYGDNLCGLLDWANSWAARLQATKPASD